MRHLSTLAAGALAAALTGLASAPATAADGGWTESGRVALFSATGLRHGPMAGHEGNWHSIVVSVNGADGVTGVVTDWTCPAGVAPDLADADPQCVAETTLTLGEARDADGESLVRVRVNRPTRNLEVTGKVAVTDAAGVESVGWIHFVGHAFGARTEQLSESADGLTRTYTATRDHTRVAGRVLGIRLHGRGFETTGSALVSVTTWTKAPSALRRLDW